jgi:hypothetical protein
VHFAVTAHPTTEWTAQQMRKAFPWDSAPRYLLRDRDRIFGQDFVKQVKAMGIKQVLSGATLTVATCLRGTCDRHYSSRVPGSRDRVHRAKPVPTPPDIWDYYHWTRVHLALEKDTPEPRPIQPPACGRIVSIPVLGGLHHRYERRAA